MTDMIKLRRAFALIVALLALAPLFGGCAKAPGEAPAETPDAGAEITIVCTIFPEFDWLRRVLGDTTAVSPVLLLDSGTDIHSYQPTADDIIKLQTADMVVYVGGESDKWVAEAVANAGGSVKAVNLMELLSDAVVEETITAGMEAEEHTEGEECEVEYDEHVWLSLRNAAYIVDKLATAISELDPENNGAYRANTDAYVAELMELDGEYEKVVAGAKYDTLLFGDRFPFRYLVRDYGLEYFAAFPGCSAETEASFETVAFLANKMDELSLPAIIVTDGANTELAKAILRNTQAPDRPIIVLDSLQSITRGNIEAGRTYIDAMRTNLTALSDALN